MSVLELVVVLRKASLSGIWMRKGHSGACVGSKGGI